MKSLIRDPGFRFSRAFIIIMGCHLTIRMRKVSHENGVLSDPSVWQSVDTKNSGYQDTWNSSEAPAARTEEVRRVDRVLDFARRFGLPPALPKDLDAFWDDPIRTVNQVGGMSGLELTSLQTHGQLHSQRQTDLEMDANERTPPSLMSSPSKKLISHVEVDVSSPRRMSSHPKNLGVDGASSSRAASSVWNTDTIYESDCEGALRTVELAISPVTWEDLERPDRGSGRL